MLSRDIRLTTARLVLRPTEPGDAPRMAQIQSNWNVTRMLRLAPWPATEATFWPGCRWRKRSSGGTCSYRWHCWRHWPAC